jgi:hypothetical protein
MTTTAPTQPAITFAVLNCPATAVLGLYTNETEATHAATRWGHASFAYELTTTEAKALAANACGYVCKSCDGPAPIGVGYAAPGLEAYTASQELTECACGYSQTPASLPGTDH